MYPPPPRFWAEHGTETRRRRGDQDNQPAAHQRLLDHRRRVLAMTTSERFLKVSMAARGGEHNRNSGCSIIR